MLMYYDARYINVSAYGGFYDIVTREPSCIYYDFKAFGELYALQNEVRCNCEQEGVYALAAQNGDKRAIILSNIKEDVQITSDLSDDFSVYVIDYDHFITETEFNPKAFTLKENTVVLIKNY